MGAAAWLCGALPSAAWSATPVEVRLIQMSEGSPHIDPALRGTDLSKLKSFLAKTSFDRMELIDRKSVTLGSRKPQTLRMVVDRGKPPVPVTLVLLEEAPNQVRLQLKIPSLKVDTQTTHKNRGLLVFAYGSKLVAVRPQ